MRKILLLTLVFCMGVILLFTGTTVHAEPGSITVEPEVLNIDTFFSGGDITISGELLDGQDIFIEIVGPAANGQFDIKGRLGPFWMTRDKAELDGAPSMYVLLLPGNMEKLQPIVSSLGLGLAKLEEKITIKSDTLNPDDIFKMFLDLKQKEGLYLEKENAVIYSSSENGHRQFHVAYRFPPSTAAGEYTIKTTAVENSVKIGEGSKQFLVEEIGFTRLVNDLATHRRILYGVLAVVIALFAGGLMGVLFKGGGGH